MAKKDTKRFAPNRLRKLMAANLSALMARDEDYDTWAKVATRANEITGAKIGRNTVKRACLGTHATTIDTLDAIARVFDADPWQLLVPDMNVASMPVLANPGASEKVFHKTIEGLAARLDRLEQKKTAKVK